MKWNDKKKVVEDGGIFFSVQRQSYNGDKSNFFPSLDSVEFYPHTHTHISHRIWLFECSPFVLFHARHSKCFFLYVSHTQKKKKIKNKWMCKLGEKMKTDTKNYINVTQISFEMQKKNFETWCAMPDNQTTKRQPTTECCEMKLRVNNTEKKL